MAENFFKICPNCGEVWSTQDDFIKDKRLELNGYKSDFEKLEFGLFFFTHKKEKCFSTMALEVNYFMNLYKGMIFSDRKTDGPECPRYCLDQEQLARCDTLCECAFVREIIHIIKCSKI